MLKKIIPTLFLLFVVVPLFTSCESRKTIVNGLDEREANEIIVFLSSRNIESYKVKDTGTGGGGPTQVVLWNISVPSHLATEAMSLLNQQGLPRRRGQKLLELFTNTGLVPSEAAEKIRYRAGLEEDLSNTLRKIDGVLDAEVKLSFPEEDPLVPISERKQKATASVYVKHSGVIDDPNLHLVTKIRRYVASGVTGLDFDNVTVISDRARFTDLPYGAKGTFEEEVKMQRIWSIIIAETSVTRFRLIFFTFLLVVLLLLLVLIWVGWKIFPLLKENGRFKELFFSVHPLKLTNGKKGEEEEEPEEEEEKEEESKEESEEEEEPPESVT